jgi:hypothetical protein
LDDVITLSVGAEFAARSVEHLTQVQAHDRVLASNRGFLSDRSVEEAAEGVEVSMRGSFVQRLAVLLFLLTEGFVPVQDVLGADLVSRQAVAPTPEFLEHGALRVLRGFCPEMVFELVFGKQGEVGFEALRGIQVWLLENERRLLTAST